MTLPTTTLLHGDCLDVMPTLPAASVQMVFADLPYAVTNSAWDVKINLNDFWRATAHPMASNYVFVFTANMQMASEVVASNKALFRHDVVWQKSKASGLHAKKMPLRSHEYVLVFAPKKHCYHPQMIAGKKYAHSGSTYNSAWHNSVLITRERRSHGSMRYPKSVICVDEKDLRSDTLHGHQPRRMHPTQKPVALLEWLIRTYTNPGDTVLDPVFGSCTTGVACLRTGRNFIGIEKDKAYFDVGSKRMAEERARLEALSVATTNS